MTANSITIADLGQLARELREAYEDIQDIRVSAERGDISPDTAAKRANHVLSELKKHTI